MTSNPDQARAIPQVISPPARWKLERVSDNRIDLTVSCDPACEAFRFPMSAEEFYRLIHQGDRLISWSVPAAEGTLTPPAATPEEVRQTLAINGYVVTADTIEAHTRFVQETPWASWVEEVPAGRAGQVAWFVDVFAVDDPQFRQAAQSYGVALRPGGKGPDAG